MGNRSELGLNVTANAIGGAIVGLVLIIISDSYLLGLLPVPLRIVVITALVTFATSFLFYDSKLVPEDESGSRAESAINYGDFRDDFAAGGDASRIYARWLTHALNHVDVFCGDRDRHDVSWFNHVLRWKSRGPRWTAAAFDRCLLIALLYPFLTILLVWSLYGHVGAAESALGLFSFDSGDMHFRRVGSAVLLLAAICAQLRGFRSVETMKALIWIAVAVALAFLSVGVGIGAGVGAFAGLSTGRGVFAVVFAITFSLSFTLLFNLASLMSILMAYNHSVISESLVFFIAFILAGALAVVVSSSFSAIYDICRQGYQQAVFQIVFVFAMIVVCFTFCWISASFETWNKTGALLLFTGVFTVVNAPFDWLALGITRGLLRQGLAREGRGPLFYAVIDVFAGLVLVAILAVTCVIAVQAFNEITVFRGGANATILPLDKLFKGLENEPGAPQYWWVWLMLFSTLVPSLINLTIAAAALMRGVAPVRKQLGQAIPTGGPITTSRRMRLAAALAAHLAVGVLLSGTVLYGLGAYLLPIGLPGSGAVLRALAEQVDAVDLPRRLIGAPPAEP